MKRAVGIIAMVVMLTGCSSWDRSITQFEPFADGTFRYQAFADRIYPVDSPGAEQDRLGWLGEFLRESNMCPSGFNVTERKAVQKSYLVYDVIYYGKCNAKG